MVQAARAFAGRSQAQFGVRLRRAPQANETALAVAVIGVVVRIAMHRGGEPEALAQRGQVARDRLRRGDAFRERDLQHGLGAGDVALDRLLDAVHRLREQLARQVVDRVAARGVRQHADDRGRAQDQQHIGQGQQGPQGQPRQQFHRSFRHRCCRGLRYRTAPAPGPSGPGGAIVPAMRRRMPRGVRAGGTGGRECAAPAARARRRDRVRRSSCSVSACRVAVGRRAGARRRHPAPRRLADHRADLALRRAGRHQARHQRGHAVD